MAWASRGVVLLDRNGHFHFRMDAAAHGVSARLGEWHLEVGARLLQAAVEIHTFAAHRDVVRRPVVIHERDHLPFGKAQLVDAELQTLLGDRDRRCGTDRSGQGDCGGQTKKTLELHGAQLPNLANITEVEPARSQARPHWSAYPGRRADRIFQRS